MSSLNRAQKLTRFLAAPVFESRLEISAREPSGCRRADFGIGKVTLVPTNRIFKRGRRQADPDKSENCTTVK